jgi:uncharacterized membrane protein (UPF0127 family)
VLRCRLFSILLALFIAPAIIGCRSASSLPTVDAEFITADGRPLGLFSVEVAASDEERSKGLMFRRELGSMKGMLFVFPSERQLSFWMKNTLIPLDMIFVSRDWRVVGVVANTVPLSEDSRGVETPSQYVFEFAGGTAARLGIGVGSTVNVRGSLPAAR